MKLHHGILFFVIFGMATTGLTRSVIAQSPSTSSKKTFFQRYKNWFIVGTATLGALLGLAGGYSIYKQRRFEQEAKHNLIGEMPEVPERRKLEIVSGQIQSNAEDKEIIPKASKQQIKKIAPFEQLHIEGRLEIFKRIIAATNTFPELEAESIKQYNELLNPKYNPQLRPSAENKQPIDTLELSRQIVVNKSNELIEKIIHVLKDLKTEENNPILFDQQIKDLRDHAQALQFKDLHNYLRLLFANILGKIALGAQIDNFEQVFDIFLVNGININTASYTALTPLIAAIMNNKFDLAQKLINEYHADISLKYQGRNAIGWVGVKSMDPAFKAQVQLQPILGNQLFNLYTLLLQKKRQIRN